MENKKAEGSIWPVIIILAVALVLMDSELFTSKEFVPFLVLLVGMFLLWYALSHGNAYVTETVKKLFRWVFGDVKWIGDVVSSSNFGYFIAALLAYFASFRFGFDVFGVFDLFGGLDPTVLGILNAVLLSLGSNMANDGSLPIPKLPISG